MDFKSIVALVVVFCIVFSGIIVIFITIRTMRKEKQKSFYERYKHTCIDLNTIFNFCEEYGIEDLAVFIETKEANQELYCYRNVRANAYYWVGSKEEYEDYLKNLKEKY